MQITNFPNSFIQVGTDTAHSCNTYDDNFIPIKYLGDIAFCLLISDVGSLEAASGVRVFLTRECLTVGSEFDTGGDYVVIGLAQTTGPYGDDFITVYSDDNCFEIPLEAEVGECLYLTVIDVEGLVVSCGTQVFKVIDDTCYTQTIFYRCEENQFGFLYNEVDALFGATYYNKIRLPITIEKPIPLRKKTGFRNSAGNYKTLSAVFEKEFECSTDYMTDFYHTRLLIALEHDTIYLVEDFFTDDCSLDPFKFYHDEDDAYEIDWDTTTKPGMHLGIAQAKFKLKEDPFYNQNSNC